MAMKREIASSMKPSQRCWHDVTLASIDLIVQAVPPVHDAIGEYTMRLASELAKSLNTRVLTKCDQVIDKVPSVCVETCFQMDGRARLNGLLEKLITTDADAVVLQYNPFAWGRRGWAMDLIKLIETFKASRPDVRLGIMFHETFMMNRGVRPQLMRVFQKHQFRRLARASDANFFSTGVWATQHRGLNVEAKTVHLPVGSNLPKSQAVKVETRRQWGIGEDDFVCGVFGGAHPSRMLGWIEIAVQQIANHPHSQRSVVLFHVGGEPVTWCVGKVPVVVTGRLDAAAASDAVSIIDLLINPFEDGISTRRGSAMAALQNGVPVLSTVGRATDEVWIEHHGNAVFLACPTDINSWHKEIDHAIRAIAERVSGLRMDAEQLYETNFDWPVISGIMTSTLKSRSAPYHSKPAL